MIKNTNLIESYSHQRKGYNPFLLTPQWQVAQLNYQLENKFYGIRRMDIHHFTDEVFILQKGRIVLIAATIVPDNITFELTPMEKGITYNVPTNCWHNLMMSEDAEVIIVENANTHVWDFEFYDLTEGQQNILNQQVRDLIVERGKET